MKRAAIIITGELRTSHNMENIMENIILPNGEYMFDIFIVCWNIQTYQENNTILEKQTDYSELQKYNPVKIQLKDRNVFKTFCDKYQIHKLANFRYLGQFYTCEEGMKLVEKYELEQNIKYDMYIRYRFDLFLTQPILFHEYDLTKIHGVNFPGKSSSHGTYWNDWFFIGDEKMKSFMKIFSKLCSGKLFRTYCSVPEILFEKSGEKQIVYDINHTIVYLNKYNGEKMVLRL
jgi:hypothetical protein